MTNRCYRIKLSEGNLGQLVQILIHKFWLATYYKSMLVNHGDLMKKHYQDRTWMIHVLFTLNPNHQLFRSSMHDCKSRLTQEDLKIIQSFNTYNCRQTQDSFFKRSKTQSIEYKKHYLKLKL